MDVERCKALLDQSLVLATPLAKLVGYGKAAALSKKALAERRELRQVVERAGEVIPYVIKALTEKRPTNAKPIDPPAKCPECGEKTETEAVSPGAHLSIASPGRSIG